MAGHDDEAGEQNERDHRDYDAEMGPDHDRGQGPRLAQTGGRRVSRRRGTLGDRDEQDHQRHGGGRSRPTAPHRRCRGGDLADRRPACGRRARQRHGQRDRRLSSPPSSCRSRHRGSGRGRPVRGAARRRGRRQASAHPGAGRRPTRRFRSSSCTASAPTSTPGCSISRCSQKHAARSRSTCPATAARPRRSTRRSMRRALPPTLDRGARRTRHRPVASCRAFDGRRDRAGVRPVAARTGGLADADRRGRASVRRSTPRSSMVSCARSAAARCRRC